MANRSRWANADLCYTHRVATVINSSGVADTKGVPKTYYLRIVWRGRVFWKLGQTINRIQDRFKKEPADCSIEIVELWHHTTPLKCGNHEAKLFKLHKKGARPFIGKTGPLVGGGNTEVFCHDVVGGEEPPKTVKVEAWNEDGWKDFYSFFDDFDPYEGINHRPFWVAHYYAPPTLSYLMPLESSETKLVVADCLLIQSIDNGEAHSPLKKRSVTAALEHGYIVETYQDALDAVRRGEFI